MASLIVGRITLLAIGTLLLAASLSGVLTAPATAAWTMAPAEALAEASAGRIVLIDVRTPAEWRRTGVPVNAATVDWWQPGGKAKFLRGVLTIVDGRRDQAIALICARGFRSSAARKFLAERGFTRVFDVSEGMLGSRAGPGWISRNLPTVPVNDKGSS